MNTSLDFECDFNFQFKGQNLFGWNCFAPLESFYEEMKKKASSETEYQNWFLLVFRDEPFYVKSSVKSVLRLYLT